MKNFNVIVTLAIMAFCQSRQEIWAGPDKKHSALPSEFAEFIEPEFPYFSTTFDARELGKEWPANNLTPRGIILDLGQGVHACFDTDLLRFALVWKESKDGEWLWLKKNGNSYPLL